MKSETRSEMSHKSKKSRKDERLSRRKEMLADFESLRRSERAERALSVESIGNPSKKPSWILSPHRGDSIEYDDEELEQTDRPPIVRDPDDHGKAKKSASFSDDQSPHQTHLLMHSTWLDGVQL